LPNWGILDTRFSDGQQFLATWADWQADPRRPRVLHYVALCNSAPAPDKLIGGCLNQPHLKTLAQQLAGQWFGLLPGFHRFLLSDGQVNLTLCVGDALQSLRQLSAQMDAVTFCVTSDTPSGAFDALSPWSIKALARCCKRGALLQGCLAANTDLSLLHSHFKQYGFETVKDQALRPNFDSLQLKARFNPPWTIQATRRRDTHALPIARCAVIGAGLAGASVAASLARRGWQVQVLDQAEFPAAGASGLPVGLVVPYVSSDDSPLSRLSRAGVRLMLQQAQRYLKEGQQWATSGVLERQVGGTPQLPATWPTAGQDWTVTAKNATANLQSHSIGPGLWHAKGAWLKPAELVRVWLAQPGISFLGHARVSQLQQGAGIWHLLDDSGKVLCSAERVVFANAGDTPRLLASLGSSIPALAAQISHLPALQGRRGLLNWALHDSADLAESAFPAFPVNGFGSIVPHVPTNWGLAWFMGSSYQPFNQPERSDADNQSRNFAHLQQLLPKLADTLKSPFAASALGVWKNTRCVSADRLPLVGPLDAGDNPSLWLCTGLGSRGMSLSVLCAELLAARMSAEPLPVEGSLAKLLNALRA